MTMRQIYSSLYSIALNTVSVTIRVETLDATAHYYVCSRSRS